MSTRRAYLFGTCLLDGFDPDAGVAAAALMRHAGLEPVYPQAQTCCGQPPFNSGYDEEARRVIRSQLRVFAEDLPILVPSGSCAAMMQKDWPRLFEGRPELGEVRAVAGRVFELFSYLHRETEIELDDKGTPQKVALHVSCSAWRSTKSSADHEGLLARLDNVELCSHPKPEECCGFGGTFAIKQSEISSAMVQDKCAALRASGADVFVCGDSGCLLNIDGCLQKQGASLRGKHLATYLWERVR